MRSTPARVVRAAAAVLGVVVLAGAAGGSVATASGATPAAAAPATASAATTTTSSPPYLTLLNARSQWAPSLDCTRLPNTISLRQVAFELHSRGLSATGSVVTGKTLETSRECKDDLDVHGNVLRPGGVQYASWADIAHLKDTYGWKFVSHSRTYTDMTTLSPAEQREEACGSLADLRARGHLRGDGLFAYPNNHRTEAIQRDVVASCFAFGRVYGLAANNRAGVTDPWLQRTYSVNGGNCNTVSLPCYSYTAPRRYDSPVNLGDIIAALGPDQWFVMQHYRFVTGHVAGRWDCRSDDWRRHWTSSAEEYCWKDYRAVLDRIPSRAVVTDPKTVAHSWGRTGYTH